MSCFEVSLAFACRLEQIIHQRAFSKSETIVSIKRDFSVAVKNPRGSSPNRGGGRFIGQAGPVP